MNLSLRQSVWELAAARSLFLVRRRRRARVRISTLRRNLDQQVKALFKSSWCRNTRPPFAATAGWPPSRGMVRPAACWPRYLQHSDFQRCNCGRWLAWGSAAELACNSRAVAEHNTDYFMPLPPRIPELWAEKPVGMQIKARASQERRPGLNITETFSERRIRVIPAEPAVPTAAWRAAHLATAGAGGTDGDPQTNLRAETIRMHGGGGGGNGGAGGFGGTPGIATSV